MDIIEKELQKRKSEIIKEIELLFKANIKITDWDIPEADDRRGAEVLIKIFEEGIEKIKKDIQAGKYDNY